MYLYSECAVLVSFGFHQLLYVSIQPRVSPKQDGSCVFTIDPSRCEKWTQASIEPARHKLSRAGVNLETVES
jgi:hypothetical protein